ncbi:MAG: hypothetical protein R3Y11_00605 [Pseudomonadota bacterium]
MKTSRILLTALTGVLVSASLCFAAHKETVKVTDAAPNKVVIKRDNGSRYELRLGSGCPAIKHYEGRDIVLQSGDHKFLGHNSKVILPKDRQQCTVTKFATVKGPTSQKKEQPKHR